MVDKELLALKALIAFANCLANVNAPNFTLSDGMFMFGMAMAYVSVLEELGYTDWAESIFAANEKDLLLHTINPTEVPSV